MRKTKRVIAALTAAIITATSTSLMSVCADENGGSDFGFVSKSTTNKSDNIEAVESDAQLYDKLGQLLKDGDSLKYGEALYTTGTPDGEKWTKEFYEQRVEFYGEDLLSKYIVDGEFLRKNVESDMNGLLKKTANELDKYVDIINEYLMSNSIAGSAYAIKSDGVDKLLITYDGQLEKIQAYIAEIGIDEDLVVYEQGHDMIVTQPATTIAVTETKPVTTITMPVVDDPTIQTEVVTVTVMSVNGDDILVKPVDGSPELKSSNKFSLSAKEFPDDIKPKAGMKLEITYNGGILETYPAQFGNVHKIVAVKDDTVKNDGILLKGTKDMTLNDVMRLAELGDELDWADFKDYKGRDVGSGLYIWEYKLEDGYVLDVGGSTDKKPIYIILSCNNEKGIDIRTNDVKEYIAATAVPVVTEKDTITEFGTGGTWTNPEDYDFILKNMTLNDVIELAKKGDELNWSDFDEYVGKDGWHGVGMYTHTCSFELGDGYVLYVGGNQPTQPETILLYHNDPKSGIDIRTDDVKEYITSSATPVSGNAENSTIKAIAEDIDKYMQSNSIAGFAYVHEEDGVEKIFISYFGALDKIQDYVAEKGINESLVVYQQSQDYTANTSMLEGDANCDGQVDLSDAVMIMQALANPNKYGIDGTAEHHLTEQGKLNGDMNGDGLTVGDAQAIQRKLLGLDKEDKISVDEPQVTVDEGFTTKDGKRVSFGLYDKLCNNTDTDIEIAVTPNYAINNNYVYNGKTISQYHNEWDEDSALFEKYGQIVKDGDKLKYGEALYTTGTPDGEKWDKDFYYQRVSFYGEEFLAKYIVNGEFLIDKVLADQATHQDEHKTINHAYKALHEAIDAYNYEEIQATIPQLEQQNIRYEYNETQKALIFYVTATQFEKLSLDNVSSYGLASSGSVVAMDL